MPWFLENSRYVFVPLLLWSSIWKGLALWHAAKRDDKWWFIVLLVINTMGILEICYLLFVVRLFSKKSRSS